MTAETRPAIEHTPDWDPGALTSVPDRMQQLSEMRSRCPVAYTARGAGYWTLLKHADVLAAALDTQTFSNGGSPRHGVRLPPLEVDPPEHREFRSILNPFFMPKRVHALEPRVRAIADRLLEPLIASTGGDLAKEFSYPLPVLTVCALLDLDEALWPEVKRLSEESLAVESYDPAERDRAKAAHLKLMAYAREVIRERKNTPRDPASDIASAIVAAKIGDLPLDDETGAGIIRLLISAGHNSTTSGLGNALLYLAQHADAQQRLRMNPGELPVAIEELLRFETPVQSMPRYLKKDAVLHGRTLRAGERLDLMFGSANRDERIFENPDRCVLDRKPNRHIAFGYGMHSCLGAPIARMEMRVALEQLLKRTRAFSLAGVVTRPPYHRLGVDSLPVKLEL
jgi:cytochrome P450